MNCSQAAEALAPKLGFLRGPKGPVRLVQFCHESPGLKTYREEISEGLINALEDSGFLLFPGLDAVLSHLTTLGYTVTAPNAEIPA